MFHAGPGGGKVSVIRYGADRIELGVKAEGASLLVAANSYNPFWRARVDGVEKPVIPVDHAFQGVFVGAGAREVVFEYSPPYARLCQGSLTRIGGRGGDGR